MLHVQLLRFKVYLYLVGKVRWLVGAVVTLAEGRRNDQDNKNDSRRL
jgi:hypothetical protein